MRALALAKDMRFAAGIAMRRPFSVLVQVTNRCNMQCSFCDFWPNAAPKRDELTTADYERVSRELADLGCFCVSIEGGEPFARPDLEGIVRAFARRHIPVLFTNGWYVTRENARALWDAGLSQASVSIDYPDAARHDRKRGVHGTFDRAWRAVELFRDTAREHDKRGRRVNVMSVLMEDNHASFAEMLAQSEAAGVGHQVTLLSIAGFRRGKGPDRMPPPEAADELTRLFARFPHVRFFGSYFEGMRDFLAGEPRTLPTCTAGAQSLNLDHVGNVSACIERIGEPVGNVKEESVATLFARLAQTRDAVSRCQDCWTACRGFQQALGGGASLAAMRDLATRMRTS
jgi:MoaA/NifB/PqqE/SkfB family radical SAM enzyme